MKLDTLKQLFVHEISDLYDAEEQLVKALPKMAKAATSPELQRAFDGHLSQTKDQLKRLDLVFEYLGEKPKRISCKGMKGLIAEGEELIKGNGESAVMDAGLIAAAQRVEHYEIAGYGCARTYAELLGETESVELLQATLSEERETDESLTELAERVINVEAAEVSS